MPNMFDLMRCGDNHGCGCGGDVNARDLLMDVLDSHGGSQATAVPSVPTRGANRANRAVDILNAVLANSVDPDPTPINSNFPLRAPLDGELPRRFSSGPQSFDQVSRFGVDPIPGDGSGLQLRDQLRTLLRQLGG